MSKFLFIRITKKDNYILVKTTKRMIGKFIDYFLCDDCTISNSNEKEYIEGLDNDLSFEVLDKYTINNYIKNAYKKSNV